MNTKKEIDIKRSRRDELEESFAKAAKIADCSITHADVDAAREWMKECEEYARLVRELDGLSPDNCIAYCRIFSRATTALEESEEA